MEESDATGTPTLTAANFSAGGGFLSVICYTGFNSSASIATPDTITAQAAASTALATGTVSNTQSSELMFGWYTASVGILNVDPPAGWTQRNIPSAVRTYDQIGVAPGTNVSMSGTFGSSQNWNAGIQGFYDAPSNTLQPFTRSQWFVTDTYIQI